MRNDNNVLNQLLHNRHNVLSVLARLRAAEVVTAGDEKEQLCCSTIGEFRQFLAAIIRYLYLCARPTACF